MLRFLLIIIVSTGAGVGAATAYYEHVDAREREDSVRKEARLSEVVREWNQNTPVKVDEYTRLDSAEVESGFALIYNYTLFGNLSMEEKRTMIRRLRPLQLHQARDNPDLSRLRDNKIDMICVYRDEEGVEIGRILLKSDEL